MRSMTGFGKGFFEKDGVAVTIEISSVNRKQLDLRFNTPSELKPLEQKFRKLIGNRVQRGTIAVKCLVDYADSLLQSSLKINRAVAGYYLKEFTDLSKQLNIPGQLDINSLVQLPEIISEQELSCDPELIEEVSTEALNRALNELVQMREAEGEELKNDLCQRLAFLKENVSSILERSPLVITEYQVKLKERVQQLLNEELELDQDSLAREVAYFADRSDISEEMTRLNSHFILMEKNFSDDKPVGRAMDFLVQEMFREINTTGSKANDSEIASLVVAFKAELERMREQIQNIE